MAAEPVVEEFEQWIPRLVPNSEPAPDPDVKYPGEGAVKLWNDVYHYGTSIVHYFTRGRGGTSYVMSDQLDEAIDGAIGATVKSLSGFINRAAQIGLDAQQWSSIQLDAMSANIGAIYGYFDQRVSELERIQNALVHNYVPLVAGEVAQLRDDMLAGFKFNSAADRQWSIDNIYRPLEENIGKVQAQALTWADNAYDRATSYADRADDALGLNVLRGIAPTIAAVAALQTESDECVKPMCDTFGPKTDIGKLLKGLKLAGEIAALTAIMQMDAGDLGQLIHAVTTRLAVLVGDLEQFFGPGGETVAGLIADATSDLV